MLRALLISLFMLMSTLPALTQDAVETHGEDVLLILDSSGSMWGQIDGTAKYEIARDVVTDILSDWSDDDALGLIVYGHRREGDCTDIELLTPVGVGNASAVGDGVASVRPLGKTPLAASLREGASALENGGAIILLTDGLESCEADPCAAAAELAASGINIRAHVIGFDLGGEDTSSLRCIADETGGMFLEASNAGELSAAFGTVIENAVADRNVTLRAVDGEGVLLEDDIQWNVYDADNMRTFVGIGGEVSLALAPGAYRIESARGDTDVAQSLDVPEGETVVIDVVFATGTLHLTAHLAEGMAAYNGRFTWTMRNAAGDEIAREAGDAVSFTLPAGTYEGRVSSEDLDVIFEAVFISGEEHPLPVTLDAGLVAVSGLGPDGSATTGHVSWTITPADDPGARAIARETRRATTFLIPAGHYTIAGTYQGETVTLDVTVEPGAELTESASFAAP